MSEGSEAAQRPTSSRIKSNIDRGKMLMGGYINLEGNLTEAKKYPVPPEVLDSYGENREIIEQIFGEKKPNELFFHGTGNFQYAGDKYTSGVTQELRHPLDTILEHGILPHHDVWNAESGGYSSSSLATTWPYAKVYADFHQSPKNPLKWEYGNKADWLSHIMAGTGISQGKHLMGMALKHPRGMFEKLRAIRSSLKANKSDGNLNRLQSWVSYVRRPSLDENTSTIFKSRTDIPGNFGVVFVVDPKGVNVAPKGPGVYEVRTLETIPPDHFKALAVPMDKVEEYRRRVFQMEQDLPVLPTEAIEYHMSQFPFEELTKNRRIPTAKK